MVIMTCRAQFALSPLFSAHADFWTVVFRPCASFGSQMCVFSSAARRTRSRRRQEMAIIYPLSSRRAMLSEKPQTLKSRSALALGGDVHNHGSLSRTPQASKTGCLRQPNSIRSEVLNLQSQIPRAGTGLVPTLLRLAPRGSKMVGAEAALRSAQPVVLRGAIT